MYITDSAGRYVPFASVLLKVVASTALGVVSDKMRGVPLSDSLKKRGLEAGKKYCLTRNPRKKQL